MSARIFVIFATLLVGIMLGVGLVVFEHVPEPAKETEQYEVTDRFLEMRFTLATRRTNLNEFGLPERVISAVLPRIEALGQRDRNGDLLQAMRKMPSEAGVLCRSGGDLPSRYAATAFLISGERGMRREVVSFDRVRTGLSIQEAYRPVDLESLYKATELQPNAQADAYALNISALLLGQEIERMTGEGRWGGGVFGPPNFISFINRNAEIEADLIEFFAQMLYLHEVARDPKNEFCSVRPGSGGSGRE